MRALILVVGLAIAGPVPASNTPSPAGPPHFEMVLTPTTSGYAAECLAGCSWRTLSFACATDCDAVIDADGVRVPATTEEGDPVFAFHFRRLSNGWRMESLGGTGWQTLGWGCGTGSCAARVTERGVSGPA